ncbi:MAG: glutamate synthase subunit alpha, partial [Rikenellaceae bacterium]
MQYNKRLEKQGLYDPKFEHDACGVGLLANIRGVKSHEIIEKGLQVLEHMVHRGAEGADPATGDGAGIMLQIPHEFILLQGITVPEKGRYGTGLIFLPKDPIDQQKALDIIDLALLEDGLSLLALRNVPVNSSLLGVGSGAAEPDIKQLFVVEQRTSELTLDARIYCLRKKIEQRFAQSDIVDKVSCYIVSLSTRIIIYKGMLSSLQLRHYFPDLVNPYFTSGMALVHSRFSTNTFPTWSLAQPFRLLGHNGNNSAML